VIAMPSAPGLLHVDRLDLNFVQKPWMFAVEHREEIDAYFGELRREKPAIWNGRVLLMHCHGVSRNLFRGDYLETDYASFAAWRHWGSPPAGVHDCFGAAAVVSSDGAVLLGVMGAQTANAGHIYFPAGTPDPSDIVNGKVDLDASMRRELQEETGLNSDDFSIDPGWTVVPDHGLVVQVKVLRSRESAEALRARTLAHLARERQPELSDIRIVRGTDDFDPAMPPFVIAFLTHHFTTRPPE
jgi:8-oxo-dGTP pyrophosphatase MutT (NUDIX family)